MSSYQQAACHFRYLACFLGKGQFGSEWTTHKRRVCWNLSRKFGLPPFGMTEFWIWGPRRLPPSIVGLNDHSQHRVDLVLPAPSVEHPIVSGTGLEVMVLQMGPQAAAQILRGKGLADRADV